MTPIPNFFAYSEKQKFLRYEAILLINIETSHSTKCDHIAYSEIFTRNSTYCFNSNGLKILLYSYELHCLLFLYLATCWKSVTWYLLLHVFVKLLLGYLTGQNIVLIKILVLAVASSTCSSLVLPSLFFPCTTG